MTYEAFFKRYHWKPSDLLGEGGFGKVYLASDEYTNQLVAIKTCPVSTQRDSLSLQHEVTLMQTHFKHPHPNIVRYEACYRYAERTGEHDFAVLQYYPDGNLQQLLDKGTLTEAQKIKIATQILDGICHYQAIPIFHRDLKPANILMAKDRHGEYVPKIGDFGISKAGALDGKTLITNTLQGGTRHYAAPEQLAGAAQLGLNADLWSYGVLVYYLFAGELPYRMDSASASSQQNALLTHLELLKKGLPLPKLRMLPEPFGQMVQACLVFDPAKRVKNAVLLRQFLPSVVEIEIEPELPKPIQDKTEDETPQTLPKPQAAASRLAKMVWVALGLGLIGSLGWLLRGDDNPNLIISTPTKTVDKPKLDASARQSYEPEMVTVEGGTFKMGSNDGEIDEKPIHTVTLSGYSIGKYEVAQAQWNAVMGTRPSHFQNCDNCPVEQVSWSEVQTFIIKLNQMTHKAYRLPTEAEWEFAASGGNKSKNYKFSGSNDANAVAWNQSNSDGKTHSIGSKAANELGIYDMTGNVWEWCSDWYGNYNGENVTNPLGANNGSERIYRGGSWFYNETNCRVTIRHNDLPTDKFNSLGFRLAHSL